MYKYIGIIIIVYAITEMFDYITGLVRYKLTDKFSSHKARIGCYKKLIVMTYSVGFVFLAQLLTYACRHMGYDVPSELAGISYLYIIKITIAEISSIRENIKAIKGVR